MRAFFSRLRVRVLLLVLLAVVPALLLMLYSAEERRRQDFAAVQENVLRLCQFTANNMERDFEATRQLLAALSRVSDFSTTTTVNCSGAYTELTRQSSLYENLGRVAPDGTVVCSALPAFQGSNVADQAWFRRAIETRGFVVGGYRPGSVAGRATINFGYPVVGREGEITSVLFAAMDFSWLNRLAEQARLPLGATLTATDRNGTVLARYPDPELWVGKAYPNAPIIKAIHDRREGQVEVAGIDGVQRIYAFSSIPGHDITVHIGFTREAAFEAANRSLRRNLAAMAAVALLALLAAWFVGDLFLVRQVNALVAATRRLGSGDLSTRTSLPYHSGELGTLARAFDEMAESLEFRDAQLRESEVERSSTESLFTEVVDNAPEAILGVDKEGNIVLFNRRAERLFGHAAREVIGQSIERLLASSSTEVLRRYVETLSAEGTGGGTPGRIDLTGRRKDGTEFPVQAAISRVGRDGRTAFTAILREAAERTPPGKGAEG